MDVQMESVVSSAERDFDNVALVLGQKGTIRPEFQRFTADLSYDLRVYRELFGDLDRKLQKDPPQTRAAAELGILTSVGRKFMAFFDDTLEELKKETSGFTKEEHERHGFYSRKQLWDVILTSEFLTLTNTKPRGYLGDPEMMAMAYENAYRGATMFGKLMHKHPLEATAGDSVRNRRPLMKKRLIAAESARRSPGRKLRFLAVASGAAYEVQDLYREEPDVFQRFEAVLLDQDTDALGQATAAIEQIRRQREAGAEARVPLPVSALNSSVRTMLRTPDLERQWGHFDFIYSMGLFDYLTPPVARAVAAKLYDLLAPGGELLIGNFHVANPSRVYMDYWMDWYLYYRTEEDMRSLLPERNPARSEVFFEPSGAQMFLHVQKP